MCLVMVWWKFLGILLRKSMVEKWWYTMEVSGNGKWAFNGSLWEDLKRSWWWNRLKYETKIECQTMENYSMITRSRLIVAEVRGSHHTWHRSLFDQCSSHPYSYLYRHPKFKGFIFGKYSWWKIAVLRWRHLWLSEFDSSTDVLT